MMQTRTKLTDAVIARATLPPGKPELVLWDAEVTGFGLRLRGGSKTYIVFYRPANGGRASPMKRLKLGTPETIPTASEARKLARAILGKVAAGADPAAERTEARRRSKANVGDLLDRYEADLIRRRYVAHRMVLSLLRRNLKPHLGKDVAELRGADYVAIIERLERMGQPGAADEFRSRCRAFLSWCYVQAKVIEHNPLVGYRRQKATRADRLAKAQHGRALSDAELIKVWQAADPMTTFGRYVRFLILTGCRRGEGAGLARSMRTADSAALDLPAVFVKQGRGHVVPVAPTLAELLDLCPVDSRSDLYFPAPRTGGTMSGWNFHTAALVKASGVAFTFHDLRRTFRTGLSRIGVDTETAELALGHARANLEGIYNRDLGRERLRSAFTLWAEHVETIVRKATPQQGSGPTAVPASLRIAA